MESGRAAIGARGVRLKIQRRNVSPDKTCVAKIETARDAVRDFDERGNGYRRPFRAIRGDVGNIRTAERGTAFGYGAVRFKDRKAFYEIVDRRTRAGDERLAERERHRVLRRTGSFDCAGDALDEGTCSVVFIAPVFYAVKALHGELSRLSAPPAYALVAYVDRC